MKMDIKHLGVCIAKAPNMYRKNQIAEKHKRPSRSQACSQRFEERLGGESEDSGLSLRANTVLALGTFTTRLLAVVFLP